VRGRATISEIPLSRHLRRCVPCVHSSVDLPFSGARGCEQPLSEDLVQEVMSTVYRKAAQLRDGTLFRTWLFKVPAVRCARYFGKQYRKIETIELGK
jgi:hypothetical protein